jgi:hypothetical protein
MLNPNINDLIAEEVQNEDLVDLREDLVKLVRDARTHIGSHYDQWDASLEAYGAERKDDKDSEKAARKKQPKPLNIPLTKAQVQTFVTFVILLYTQNENPLSVDPTGNEDFKLRDIINKLLGRECRNNAIFNKWVQFLLDVARFNLGVMKTTWRYETYKYQADVSVEMMPQATETDMLTLATTPSQKQEVVKYEGNYVENITPYNFFYDTNMPITRWQEGVFAADETSYSIRQIKGWEKQGMAFGTKFLNKMEHDTLRTRGETRLPGFGDDYKEKSKNETDKNFNVVVTTVYYRMMADDYNLGEDEQEELYEIKLANDDRIISIEPFDSRHCMFPYDIATMSPDHLSEISDSLAKLIDPLQEVVTWLFNSRIASVRTNLQGRVVVDGRHIELEDLQTGAPYIRAKKSAPPIGLDKFVHQLRTVDTTMSHLSDAGETIKLINMVSGVNENAMGQVASGRRSATENRAANTGASSRMKMEASCIWNQAMAPQGKKMLLNLRQEISLERFIKILGESEEIVALYPQFKPENSYELIESEDFFVEDSTTATEKGYVAQSLQELVVAVMSNPMVMQVIPLDLKAMIEEIQSLRGVRNLSRFFIQTPEQQMELQNGLNRIQPPAAPELPAQA